MYTKNGELIITIAGVNKNKGSEYMTTMFGKDAYDEFDDSLYFPPEWTGKNTHVYQDEEMKGVVIDYLGNSYEYDELSSIYMEAAEYSLSMVQDFLNFVQERKIITF